jgi:hypothetical protein
MNVNITNNGPITGTSNQYSVTLACTSQTILGGSIQYECTMVQPNMWCSNYPYGETWLIVSITSVDPDTNSLTCVIQDVECYNFAMDPDTGEHGPNDGSNGYVYELSPNGTAAVFPYGTNDATFAFNPDLIARHNSRNYYQDFIPLQQPGSSFSLGQSLYINNGNFTAVTSNVQNAYIIGTVTSIGCGTYGTYQQQDLTTFSLKPNGTYIPAYDSYFMPGLNVPLGGTIGSIYYLDSSGNLTLTIPSPNAYPAYIQITPTIANVLSLWPTWYSGMFGSGDNVYINIAGLIKLPVGSGSGGLAGTISSGGYSGECD